MFAYVVLAALCLGAVSADDPNHRVVCGEIVPKSDVSIPALTGNWVAVETLEFTDGHPNHSHDDDIHKSCLYTRSVDATDSGMTVKTETHFPEKDLKTETSTLTVVGDDHARLSVKSDINDRENWEFIIMDADPEKYLVYALCLPPNEAGERLPSRVNLLSRHTDHSDHELITNDEELKIEKKIGEKLHLTGSGAKPTKFSHDCWASYAEPQ